MALMDIAIHLTHYETTVEVTHRENTIWVDLTGRHGDELTFFVRTMDQAEALAAAFEACGAKRVVEEPANVD